MLNIISGSNIFSLFDPFGQISESMRERALDDAASP
jgi:hypothetical protein